jgi:hypothetical protein
MKMFLSIVAAWFVTAYLMHILYFLGFFGGFFHAFITGDFWRGVFFATLLIFIFEAIYKYSLGMEGDEYARTYIGKAWHFLYALYEKLTGKAAAEKQKLLADLRKKP